jgi:septum site-determining protein MinC
VALLRFDTFLPLGTMAIASEGTRLTCYDIKSADLSMVALMLKTVDVDAVSKALQRQLAQSPGFFDQDPLIIDVSGLDHQQELCIDFTGLIAALKAHALMPLAIKGATALVLAQAKAAGLLDASDARIRRIALMDDGLSPHPSPMFSKGLVAPAEGPAGALIIDKPLRSGQQVYAKGRDLVVMAMVNAGAEVIADGHIHIYASLRGKAMAGARGNTAARIFALSMEPELVSIAGVYRTSENAFPPEVLGMPAQVCLQAGPHGEKLLVTPLKP